MEVTDVRVRKIIADGKMKAIVSVTFDESFVVHDVKVVEGQNGLFVAMPSRRTPDGVFRDIAHPINSLKFLVCLGAISSLFLTDKRK